MRQENNPLDLNNLPEDYSRDGKQVLDEGSSSGYRKKKSGAKNGKEECGKVYECRFCSLKFCKSQALGGHMNRHRQERETETLNRARQLVFNSDTLAAPAGHPGCHPMGTGSYIPAGNIGDPFRSVYPPRMFPGSSSTLLPAPQNQHPHQSYLYTPPSRLPAYNSQYPQHPINDYYIGHVLNNTSQTYPSHQNMNYNMGGSESNYTCIGAPVGHGGFGPGSSRSTEGSGRDGSLSNQEEGLNWGRNHAAGGRQQQCLDHPSSINRFQDGF
ncbi:zinc finger protein JAGGED-like [Populus alba x Populus x berolinensis]|uniref:zinc finger protein JAGGED n=1 Tax=Populus alba TaxID=43335 RepID=UPI00158A2651|nr:zinc finger protein JAGGED-like [Populus alba]KAJ6899292.1 zinc finger protein JAGGED-like [Populus alba x Populus x berolinensis]